MSTVAVGIFCKTPRAGRSKTRLSPPLSAEESAALSACFIRDLAQTVDAITAAGDAVGYAVYTPGGTELALRTLVPARFRLLSQRGEALGTRLQWAVAELLQEGHDGVILLNADSPTLPAEILRQAIAAVRSADCVVLSPALDGGYMLVGLSRPHAEIFTDIPWSTAQVYETTLVRARAIDLPVVAVPGWYDIDDAPSLAMLEAELAGQPLPFPHAGLTSASAPATRRFLSRRHAARPAAVPS